MKQIVANKVSYNSPVFSNFRMKLLCCLFVSIGFVFVTFSQNKKALNREEVKKLIYEYYNLKSQENELSYVVIENKLDSLEKAVVQTKDKKALLTFYKEKADFFYYENDHKAALAYINKGLEILKHFDDKRSLGLLYESLGLLRIDGTDLNNSIVYMQKSADLLNKYGETKDKVDCNMNLGMYYQKDLKDWKRAIESFKLAQKNNNLSDKDVGKDAYINLFITECYLELNELELAQKYFDQHEKQRATLNVDYSFNARYYHVKGLRYSKLGNFEKAYESFLNEREFTTKMFNQRHFFLKNYIKVKSNFALSDIENKKIKSENELILKNLEYRKIVLFLSFIVIIILLLFFLLKYRDEVFKAEKNKELEKSNLDLANRNDQIQQTLSAKKKFLDVITFELRSPLNIMKGYANKVKQDIDDDEFEKYSKAMVFSSEYLANLINDMIESNVIEELKPIQLNSKPTNIREMFANMFNCYKLNDENASCISHQIDEKISKELKMDVFRLNQLFVNLNFIENTTKSISNSDVSISIQLASKTEDKELINFVINDTGILFDQENQKRIVDYLNGDDIRFKDYFENASDSFVSLKKLLKLFNSKINISSDEGKGAFISFSIDFEIVKETINKEVKNNAEIGKDITILLVEDNKINQILTKKILEKNGFKCEVAGDGLEAVNIMKVKDYSLILMDIMMPIMDGFEASIEIKKFKPSIPIVALTAVSEDVNRERFDECDIKIVLTKPVDVNVLCETIFSLV